jgi:ABC-type lipoprotein release transport system permease subunit
MVPRRGKATRSTTTRVAAQAEGVVRQIVFSAVAAAFAGLLAAAGPARRAARMNMLAAMTTE